MQVSRIQKALVSDFTVKILTVNFVCVCHLSLAEVKIFRSPRKSKLIL